MQERVSIGHEMLNIYQGRKDWQTTLPKHLTLWEAGGRLLLTEFKLVTILQIYRGWTDEDMVGQAGADMEAFQKIVAVMTDLRSQRAELIYLPATVKRLQAPGFATTFDVEALG